MDVQVVDDELEAYILRLKEIPPKITAELRRSMQRVVLKVEGDAKRFVPVRTHHLQRSITSKVMGGGASLVGIVGTNVPYARAIEEGRPPVTIRPKKGKYLKFEIDGQTIFAKVVHQPARPARPYLRRSIVSNRAFIHHEFQQVVPRAMGRR